MAAATIHLPDIMERMTLRFGVTGKRRTAIRMWLMTRIIVIAGWVGGVNVEVDMSPRGVTPD